MKIELEVSEDNEYTSSPYWLIIDPKQMMKPDAALVAMGMITGPFFSRKEAQDHLDSRRYNYSNRAVVWCAGGTSGSQYDEKYKREHSRGKR